VNAATMNNLEMPYYGCNAHLIHLGVSEARDQVDRISEISDGLRKVVSYVRCSTIASARLSVLQSLSGSNRRNLFKSITP
jgi:hypothetical protein